jgi:3-dehydroquinate synthase
MPNLTANKASQQNPTIGIKSLERLNKELIKPEFKDANLFILVDENTMDQCLPVFEQEVERVRKAEIIEIPAGEENKDIEICKGIWLSLAELGADRNSVLINLGGGMLTDIGGFAASTYMRGIRYFNVPTTLMGMADAGIGGKSGIDLDGLKNMVGVFGKPEGVYIYPPFLATLPVKELRSGYAEILKHALIADEDMWESLKSKPFKKITNWQTFISKSADIKMSLVVADPYEKDLRKVLNFGHTIGHALESASLLHPKKNLLHGEAIAIGIICESYLSHKLLGLSELLLDEISAFILSVFPWKPIPGSKENLLNLMKSDKKNVGGHMRFTLLADIGQVMINQKCPDDWIEESIKYYETLKD